MANEDQDYTDWLRQRPCCSCGRHGVQVHHKTGAGMGLRSHDHDAMPLCIPCHSDLHCLTGRFATWNREELREWQSQQAAMHRAGYKPPASQTDFDEANCF